MRFSRILEAINNYFKLLLKHISELLSVLIFLQSIIFEIIINIQNNKIILSLIFLYKINPPPPSPPHPPPTHTYILYSFQLNDRLEVLDIDYKSTWDFWQNLVALGGLSFALLVLCYIQLRCMKKTT